MISKRPIVDLTDEDIEWVFSYHQPHAGSVPKFEAINVAAQQFARTIRDNVAPGPDRTVAVRTLQVLRMECNLAIALEPEPDSEEPEEDINF